jgi:RNA polymerase sigma factor (sigma-70 family)
MGEEDSRRSVREEHLVALSHAGSLEATEALLRLHAPYIESLMWTIRVPVSDLDDARQAAIVGLLRAVKKFNPQRETTLRTFAYTFMLGEVMTALYGRQTVRKHRVQLLPLLDQDQAEEDPALGIVEQRTDVARFLQGLTTEEQDLVRRVYWEEMPQAEIARREGVHRVAIHRRVTRVLAKGGEVLGEAVA